jgi:transcriptional regulator with GAF, ATPase, and Fis domain
LEDRLGWFEVCSPLGCVFLDEIGDIDIAIQVKLLRVLQTRTFQRLGETENRRFAGKLMAATNRDLAAALRDGRFRDDLYYRLCSDIITTPSLREQLREAPGELRVLTRHIARRVVGDDAEALTDEVVAWIDEHLGPTYAWPGNVRELEQCIRNVLIRRGYEPRLTPPGDVQDRLADDFCGGRLSADDVLNRYCTIVYAQTGNYAEAARRLGLDRRTVKARIDGELLGELRPRAPRTP